MALLAILASGGVRAGTNVWTSLGPEGGSIQSLVIDPQNSRTVYALAGAAIFKSTDGTANWRLSTDGGATWRNLWPSSPLNDISAIAIDPQSTDTIYVGSDAGFSMSTDGGASWDTVIYPGLKGGSLGDLAVSVLAIDPRSPRTLYAGTYGGGGFTITFAP